MFIGDIFNKKKITESVRPGEYVTFRVFFDDGTDETLNFSGDDINWDRVGDKRGKRVVNVKRQGGIQGSQSDSPREPHEYSDDRGLARAQRAYDKQLPEGVTEGAVDTVKFEVDSEKAYNHIMEKFGSVIDWDGDIMVAPRRYWGAIQELAYAAGGEASEEQGVEETSDYFRRREREEAIISGKKPARKKSPAQTSDYAKRREQEKNQGVAEAIPYALSAANAAAEYRRQGAAGGGYRGRIDIPVQSREDYLAVGNTLTKVARAAGQRIEFGLSDGVMSIFSDSMTSDELDEFIDRVLNQGLAEGSSSDLEQLIQQYEDMVENVYGMVPGPRQRQAIADRDALEARIEAMPGGKAALEKWARAYNDGMDESVAEGAGMDDHRYEVKHKDTETGEVKSSKVRATSPKQARQEVENHYSHSSSRWKHIDTRKIDEGVAEGSVQDRLYQRHQELRKKSGLPDPDYYKELRATYDLPDKERYAKVAELKKKYKVKESTVTNEDREKYLEEMTRAGYDVVTESATLCPECGGTAYADRMLAEKQDACYSKVKSRYKVWPSAYASGALVRCRKVGAKNWGNKSKK